jgi:hypothetical protein
VTWPDGSYTISVNATGANGQQVGVSTQVHGVVSAVDVSQTPPQLTWAGRRCRSAKSNRSAADPSTIPVPFRRGTAARANNTPLILHSA